MGPLNRPKLPDVAGLETFAGPAFHASNWDYSVELDGKNVVVIGTGASAIQLLPQIAPHVGRLTIFQRTAPWIVPRGDKPVGAAKRALPKLAPLYGKLVRGVIY
jgi:cation diffusion facilitator CzcD-associated flavoprotein CzcO